MKHNLLKEHLKIPVMVTLRAVPMAVRNLPGFFIYGGVKMKKEIMDKIEMAVFQIHAFAKVLENEEGENPSPVTANNEWSNEQLSLYQVIAEKAEFCLKAIDENRADNKVEVAA